MPTLAVSAAIYGGYLALTWFFNDLPLVAAAALGSVLLAWHSSLQHETIHGHPTNSRRINALFGWPPLALWLPYELYRETHLRHHRCKGGRLTDPGCDPESHYLPRETLVAAGPLRRAVFWFNRTFVGRLTLGPAISIYRLWAAEIRRLRAGDLNRVLMWLRHAASAALVAVWVVDVCHIPLLLYVGAVVYPSISLGLLRSFAEHGAHSDPALRTNVVETNRALSLLFLNNNLHVAHHARPSMPWYALPSAWRDMQHGAMAGGTTVRRGYGRLIAAYFLRPIIAAEYQPDGEAFP